jgi:hypothetical protein
MRRLNSIVATLLNPEEREEYDDQLRGGEAAQAAANQRTWHAIPWWIASTLATIVLTVGAMWFWKDRMGSSISYHPPVVIENLETSPNKDSTVVPVPMEPHDAPAHGQPESPVASTKSKEPFPVTPTPVKPVPPAVSNPAPQVSASLPVKKFVPQGKASLSPVVPAETRKPARVETAQIPRAIPTPPATPKVDGRKKPVDIPLVSHVDLPKQQGDLAPAPGNSVVPPNGDNLDVVFDNGHVPVPNSARGILNTDPLEGEWVYAPSEPEKPRPGLYPPEFIKLKLIKQPDGMHGEYSARYNVVDSRQTISPEVSFVLKSVDKNSRRYTWTAADGRHGTFEIRFLESDTMRLEWRTTGGRTGLALNSGMATLVRKN